LYLVIVSYNNNSNQHHYQQQRSVEILDRSRRMCRMRPRATMLVCDRWNRERRAKASPSDSAGHRLPQTLTTTMWAISGLTIVVWLLAATSVSSRYPVVLGESWPVCRHWHSQWLYHSSTAVRTASTTVSVLSSPRTAYCLVKCFVFLSGYANNISPLYFVIYAIYFSKHLLKKLFYGFKCYHWSR